MVSLQTQQQQQQQQQQREQKQQVDGNFLKMVSITTTSLKAVVTEESSFREEYSVGSDDTDDIDDDNDRDENDNVRESIGRNQHHHHHQPSKSNNSIPGHLEYAALFPGSIVEIEIGDLQLARKAWKKRRRSGSPLLIPCSILHVDRLCMIRWNVLYLLEKFGSSQKDGIVLSLSNINKWYRQQFKTSLMQHANALGYDTTYELIHSLFDKKIQLASGVEVWTENNDNNNNNSNNDSQLWIKAHISRFRAQKKASKAAMLQVVCVPEEDDHDDGDDTNTKTTTMIMKHTGHVRCKNDQNKIVQQPLPQQQPQVQDENNNNNNGEQSQPMKRYRFPLLSVALRVNQRDGELDTTIQNGTIRSAVVVDYDVHGDGGLPLLSLSLNPSSRNNHHPTDTVKVTASSTNSAAATTSTTGTTQTSTTPIRRATGRQQWKYQPMEHTQDVTLLEDCKVGDGPLQGKVVRLLRNKALIDCNIGRKFKKTTTTQQQQQHHQQQQEDNIGIPDIIKVFGTLRFKDVQSEEELLITKENHSFDDSFIESDFLRLVDEEINDQHLHDDDDHHHHAETGPNMDDVLEKLSAEYDDNNEDEDVEDITHLFQLSKDGSSLSYHDPETGETNEISLNDDDHDDHDDHHDVEASVGFGGTNRSNKRTGTRSSTGTITTTTTTSTTSSNSTSSHIKKRWLRMGDMIPVYIKSVSKQSNQFTVTMDPIQVYGKTAKDMKQEKHIDKKLKRLEQSIPGGLDRIQQLTGTEYTGIVKAKSKTGNWFYVQPTTTSTTTTKGKKDHKNDLFYDDDNNETFMLPVGVATIDMDEEQLLEQEQEQEQQTTTNVLSNLNQGDLVRVQLQGIDEERGQLSMRVLEKLKP